MSASATAARISATGPALIVAFALSQAVRDVYFAGAFQGISIQLVILVSFVASTLLFGAWALWRAPHEWQVLRRHLGLLLAMNIATALSWNCYFFALRHLEPALVNTIHSGLGPLTVIAMGAAGVSLAGAWRLKPIEALWHTAGLLTLLGLAFVALTGRSGLDATPTAMQMAALASILLSGSSITMSLLLARRLHDAGCGAELLTATRYLLILLVAGLSIWLAPEARASISAPTIAWLSVLGFGLIVLPLYALQLGIARTPPLTAHVIRSLGPVFVFALEQIDGRITFVPPVLALIVAYSVCAIGASLSRR